MQLKGEIMDLEFTIDTDHRLVPPIAPNVILSTLLADLLTAAPLYSHFRPKIGRGGGIGLPKAV
jgi:hypothetical protein